MYLFLYNLGFTNGSKRKTTSLKYSKEPENPILNVKRARLQPGQYAELSGMNNSGEGSGSETESSQTTPEPSSSQTIPDEPTPPTTPPDGQTTSSQTTTTPPSGQTSSSETTKKVRKTMHGWMDSVVQELMIVGVKSNGMMRV